MAKRKKRRKSRSRKLTGKAKAAFLRKMRAGKLKAKRRRRR